MILRPRITKEKLAALIKAVEEGGDDDDEITEDEAIAIPSPFDGSVAA